MSRVTFLPFNVTLNAEKGQTILDLAFENDIILEHNCGGLCACTSCRVLIHKGSELLNEKSAGEIFLLNEGNFNDKNTRLGCQCIIIKENDKEIIVEIPQNISNE